MHVETTNLVSFWTTLEYKELLAENIGSGVNCSPTRISLPARDGACGILQTKQISLSLSLAHFTVLPLTSRRMSSLVLSNCVDLECRRFLLATHVSSDIDYTECISAVIGIYAFPNSTKSAFPTVGSKYLLQKKYF